MSFRNVGLLGRAGQGPGELENPTLIGLTPDGNLRLVQVFFGRAVFLARDGAPMGSFAMPQQANPVLQAFAEKGGVRVLATSNLVFLPDSAQVNKNSLWAARKDGSVGPVFVSSEHRIFRDPPCISEEGL